jgi:LysM repeat protein
MLRRLPSRRALSGALAATVLLGAAASPVAAGDEIVVRPGDTLWDIALAHDTTVSALVALNQITNPNLIQIGQRLLVRDAATPALVPAAPTPVAPAGTYVVAAGDTLWGIAQQHSTTVAALAKANGIGDPSFIRIGQSLVIPNAGAAPAAPAVASPPPKPATPAPVAATVHVVGAGDTLWAIASRYGVTIGAIASANQLADPSLIRVGQRLTIPGTVPTSAPALTTAGMPADMAVVVTNRSGMRDHLLAAAHEFGVAPAFVLAVAWQESGWNPGAVSFAGAIGLMQLMPDTAQWVGDAMLHEAPAIRDPRWNARAGTRLLAFYLSRYGGDKTTTLAAYFQGMASVDQTGIHASSRAYVANILRLETIFGQ